MWPGQEYTNRIVGSKDGDGAGDHDKPYRFWRPRVAATFPFSERQYARLLVLRSRYSSEQLEPRWSDAA